MEHFRNSIINNVEQRLLLKVAYQCLETLTDQYPFITEQNKNSEGIRKLWEAYEIIKELEEEF